MAETKKPTKGTTSITRNGVTYWYARVDGKRVYCGKDAKGKKLAEAARAKYIAKRYENRELSAGVKVKRPEFKTVKDLANWFMELPTVQEKKNYPRRIAAAAHLLAYFKDNHLSQVEGDEQEQYRAHRRGEGDQDGTIDYEIGLLRTMYRMARKRKKIPADYIPGEFILKGEVNPRRIITDEEFEEILKHGDPHLNDILVCGYESAMRLQEILTLTPNQVHLGVKHISGEYLDYIDLGIFDTKNGARRTVPVSARLKEVLKRRMKGIDPDDRIFTNGKGRKYHGPEISRRLEYACREAGIPYGDKALNSKGERIGIVFHCLRHTRTTKWVEAGFSDEIVRRATGHKSLSAYQQYVKLDPHAVMRLVGEGLEKRHTNGIKTAESLNR
jgi:integrase